MTDAEILIRAGVSREELGRLLRQRWTEWAMRQPHPKRSWLKPWGELTVAEQEVDMIMAETLFCAGWRGCERAGPP